MLGKSVSENVFRREELPSAELTATRDLNSAKIVKLRRDARVVGLLRGVDLTARVTEDEIVRCSLAPHLSAMHNLLNAVIGAVEHTSCITY